MVNKKSNSPHSSINESSISEGSYNVKEALPSADISSVSNILELVKGCGENIDWEIYGNTPIGEYICGEDDLCGICETKISSEKKRISDLIKKNEDFLKFLKKIEKSMRDKGNLKQFSEYVKINNKIESLQEELRKLKQAEKVA